METDIDLVWTALESWFNASGSENEEEYEAVCNAFQNILIRLDVAENGDLI